MRRFTKTPRRLNSDSQRLISFAEGVLQASSRLEERGWEAMLDAQLQKLLHGSGQDAVDAALDHSYKTRPQLYDVLMEAVEAAAETVEIVHEDQAWEGVLIAAPILAWTRFAIAAGPIHGDMLATLTAHLYAHILAPDVKLALSPTLYAIDQLPRSHSATHALAQQLGQAALKGAAARPTANMAETAPFLADTRFLLAVAMVPKGSALFTWQAAADPAGRDAALAQWRAQAQPNVARLLPGCGVELLLPEAYFVACREADKHIRPASIRAAVHYLTHTLNVEARELRAIIGAFGEDEADAQVDEYRIGFTLADEPEVMYGVIWPLYGSEEADPDPEQGPESEAPAAPIEEILALLRESGIVNIQRHRGCFAMDFCDDCGAPLYLDPEAELVHAEMPEEAASEPKHFH